MIINFTIINYNQYNWSQKDNQSHLLAQENYV